MDNGLPMTDMKERTIYRLRSRNLVVGVWRAESRGFIGIREKFGSLYLFEEYHYETGAPFGTARAYTALGQVPDDMELSEDNDALFDLLAPFDAEINRQIAEEDRIAHQERMSRQWAPKTREQLERERRVEEAKAWWAAERQKGERPFRELMVEFQERLSRALLGETDEGK